MGSMLYELPSVNLIIIKRLFRLWTNNEIRHDVIGTLVTDFIRATNLDLHIKIISSLIS